MKQKILSIFWTWQWGNKIDSRPDFVIFNIPDTDLRAVIWVWELPCTMLGYVEGFCDNFPTSYCQVNFLIKQFLLWSGFLALLNVMWLLGAGPREEFNVLIEPRALMLWVLIKSSVGFSSFVMFHHTVNSLLLMIAFCSNSLQDLV